MNADSSISASVQCDVPASGPPSASARSHAFPVFDATKHLATANQVLDNESQPIHRVQVFPANPTNRIGSEIRVIESFGVGIHLALALTETFLDTYFGRSKEDLREEAERIAALLGRAVRMSSSDVFEDTALMTLSRATAEPVLAITGTRLRLAPYNEAFHYSAEFQSTVWKRLDRLEAVITLKASEIAQSGRIFEHPFGTDFWYFWLERTSEDAVSWASSVGSTETGRVRFLKMFLHQLLDRKTLHAFLGEKPGVVLDEMERSKDPTVSDLAFSSKQRLEK